MGYSWEQALGAVFLSGILSFSFSVSSDFEKWVINAIPSSLKLGIAAWYRSFPSDDALQTQASSEKNPATIGCHWAILSSPISYLWFARFFFFVICACDLNNHWRGHEFGILVHLRYYR